MKLKSTNFMIVLAGFLVVALAIMGYILYQQDKTLKSLDKATLNLTKQSQSDDTQAIENDLEGTDLSDLDKEVVNIEAELGSEN
jgi:hypothetical protein